MYSELIQKHYMSWLERKTYKPDVALDIIRVIQIENNEQKKDSSNNRKCLLNAYEDFYKMDKNIYSNWFMLNFDYDYVKRSLNYRRMHDDTIQYLFRDFILLRDLNTCKICGSTENIQVDHIIPKLRFPVSHPWNLQCLCETCNKDKSAQLLNQYIYMIKAAKEASNKLFSRNQIKLVYKELSKYYKTPIIDGTEISVYEKYFDKLIENNPKAYPEHKDILDFINN